MLLGVELLIDTYLNGEEQRFKHITSSASRSKRLFKTELQYLSQLSVMLLSICPSK